MIVDSSIFYWIGALSKLNIVGWAMMIVCTIVGLLCIDGDFDHVEKKIIRKVETISIVGIIIGALIVVFVPSEDTMYKMLIARYVTTDNINMTLEEMKNLIDYITQKIAELKG